MASPLQFRDQLSIRSPGPIVLPLSRALPFGQVSVDFSLVS
jgi:hypothetical protein